MPKQLIKEVFNYSSVPGDEDGLMSRFKELSGYELSEIKELWSDMKKKLSR